MFTCMYTLYRLSWIKQYGEHFQENCFVHCGWQRDLPTFARIVEILLVADFPLLAVEVYATEFLNSHLQSYCVKRTHALKIVYLAQLENRYPLYLHTHLGDKQTYIALRSHIEKLT